MQILSILYHDILLDDDIDMVATKPKVMQG